MAVDRNAELGDRCPMRSVHFVTILALVCAGCGSSSGSSDSGATGGTGGERVPVGTGGSGGTDAFVSSLSHVFPPVYVDVGGEVADVCQSWTLNNEEPLYVNAVRQTNEGGWHHSNWTFGPEEVFDGPDGTWNCEDRGYALQFAVAAGGVLFAQSTQALEETQSFADGAVIVIPPHSRITGNIHLINLAASAIDNSLRMELGLIPEDEVKVKLRPVGIFNTRIAVDPQAESRFELTCGLEDLFKSILQVDQMPEFNMYYVLGHYHAWGNYLNLSYIYRDGSERTIVDYDSRPGDVLGVKLDPPMPSDGAVGMRLTCGYNNDTDELKTWGIGTLEMCAFFGYLDADLAFQGQPGGDDALVSMGEDEQGRKLYDVSGCSGLFGIPLKD